MSRRYCGSAFQSFGPAMLNALLPATVDRVNGTHSQEEISLEVEFLYRLFLSIDMSS